MLAGYKSQLANKLMLRLPCEQTKTKSEAKIKAKGKTKVNNSKRDKSVADKASRAGEKQRRETDKTVTRWTLTRTHS